MPDAGREGEKSRVLTSTCTMTTYSRLRVELGHSCPGLVIVVTLLAPGPSLLINAN